MIFLFGSLFAGLSMGLLYFGGLWLTVRIAIRRKNPGLLRLSHAARLLALGFGLALIGATAPRTLALVLLGVLAARTALITLVGRTSHAA